MIFREKIDAAFALQKKYTSQSRAGWVNKGSRARANEAIMVPREEAKTLSHDLYMALYSKAVCFYETENLIHYMEQLAPDFGDATKCPHCHHAFSQGWMHGKCPYCEAYDAAKSVVDAKGEKV